MSFFSGKSGKVTVGATTLKVQSWDIEPTTDLDDTTNSSSGGYYEGEPKINKLTGKVQLQWDAASNPTTNPPNLVPGAQVALKLYVDATHYWNIAKAFITNTPVAVGAKEGAMVTFAFSFTASGAWTPPAGSW